MLDESSILVSDASKPCLGEGKPAEGTAPYDIVVLTVYDQRPKTKSLEKARKEATTVSHWCICKEKEREARRGTSHDCSGLASGRPAGGTESRRDEGTRSGKAGIFSFSGFVCASDFSTTCGWSWWAGVSMLVVFAHMTTSVCVRERESNSSSRSKVAYHGATGAAHQGLRRNMRAPRALVYKISQPLLH